MYRKNKNKFEQIKKKIPPGVDADEVIAQVVRGKSVDAVISGFTKKEIKEPEVETVSEKTDYEVLRFKEQIRKYEESLEGMKEYQDELKNELALKDNKIRKLEELVEKQRTEVYKQLKKEKIIKIRNKEIMGLQGRIRESKK